MKELLKENWNYVLYEHDGKLLLSVMCGSVALFDRNIFLSSQEEMQYSIEGKEFVVSLANKIRNNPKAFIDKHVRIP